MMTDLEILAVKNSWSYVMFKPEEVSMLFYNKLFDLDPSLKPLFKGNIEAQGEKLINMLTLIISRLQKFQDLEAEIKVLGERHVGYGIRTEHYKTVGQALLWTLEGALGEHWNEEICKAWTEAYQMMANTMIGGTQNTTLSRVIL